MLKNYAAASALVLALSTPALAQGANDFRLQSMQSNAFEIQSSQIALSKSRNPRVRSYAQEVIRDHRAANVALAGGQPGAMAGGEPGLGGLITAPIAVAGSAVGAGVGAATGVVGGTLAGGPGRRSRRRGCRRGERRRGGQPPRPRRRDGDRRLDHRAAGPRAAGDAGRAFRDPGRPALRSALRKPADPGAPDGDRDDAGLRPGRPEPGPAQLRPAGPAGPADALTRPSACRARCKRRYRISITARPGRSERRRARARRLLCGARPGPTR